MSPLHPASLLGAPAHSEQTLRVVREAACGGAPEVAASLPGSASAAVPQTPWSPDTDGTEVVVRTRRGGRHRTGTVSVLLPAPRSGEAGPVAVTPLPGPDGTTPGRGRHRRYATRSRRPVYYLSAALVGATGIGLVSTGAEAPAQADAVPPLSVSVAEQLGRVEAQEPVTPELAAERLGEMAASRAEREQAEVVAAQAQAAADQAVADAAAAAAAEAARPRAVLPVQGARLTSGFGYRWGSLHAGIDLAAPMGTPEYAVMDGVVLEAGPASGYGNVVYLQHENGDVTVYGHMEQILVQAGQTVRAGDTIALLGNRGQSTGPHLHFEVILGGIGGEKVDPLPWLLERGVVV